MDENLITLSMADVVAQLPDDKREYANRPEFKEAARTACGTAKDFLKHLAIYAAQQGITAVESADEPKKPTEIIQKP